LPGSYGMQVGADAPGATLRNSRRAAKVEMQVDVPDVTDPDEVIDLGILTPVAGK
jgi:hypothetical protein